MRRTVVLAVAAAVVLLGTVQVATGPDRMPDPLARPAGWSGWPSIPSWSTMLEDGSLRRPLPLASSVNTVVDDDPVWLTSGDGFGYPGAGTAFVPDQVHMTSPYTQIVISPTGQVLAVCEQRVRTWVPPCLLDAVAQAR